MKKLVVYYSFEGNTEFIAKVIADTVVADLLKLRSVDETNPRGFMKYIWGGRQVIMKQKPQLLPLDKQPKDYDILFIGTPVWAFSYAPPLATFFSSVNIRDKKIALFCCHGGGKGKTLAKMKQCLTGNEIIGEIDFFDPLKRNKQFNTEKAQNWAKQTIL